MVEYKYYAHDDENRIPDKVFDNFADAFDYCQDGLVTFITEIPYVDGVEDEDNEEVVWTWDNTWDRDEAIAEVEGRHSVAEAKEAPEEKPEEDFWIDIDDIQAKPVEHKEVEVPDDNQAIGFFDTEFPEVEVKKEECCIGCESGQRLIELLKKAAVDFRTLHRNLEEGNWFVIHELIGDYYEEIDHFEDLVVENFISLGCCDKKLEGDLLEVRPYSEKEALTIIKDRLDEIKEASVECRKSMNIPAAVNPVLDELEQWIQVEADYKLSHYFGDLCKPEEAKTIEVPEEAEEARIPAGEPEEAKAETEVPVDEAIDIDKNNITELAMWAAANFKQFYKMAADESVDKTNAEFKTIKKECFKKLKDRFGATGKNANDIMTKGYILYHNILGEDLIAKGAPEKPEDIKLDQKKVSEIHKGKEEHVPGSIVEEMQSDVETALATPGTWGVEFVGDDVTCYDNEAEARAEFDSIKLEDIPADCEGVNLFKVNDDGTSETVEVKTIYDKLEEEYSKVLSDYVRERMAKGEKVNDIVDSEEFKELAIKEGKKDLGLDEEKLAAGLAEAMTDIPDDENE